MFGIAPPAPLYPAKETLKTLGMYCKSDSPKFKHELDTILNFGRSNTCADYGYDIKEVVAETIIHNLPSDIDSAFRNLKWLVEKRIPNLDVDALLDFTLRFEFFSSVWDLIIADINMMKMLSVGCVYFSKTSLLIDKWTTDKLKYLVQNIVLNEINESTATSVIGMVVKLMRHHWNVYEPYASIKNPLIGLACESIALDLIVSHPTYPIYRILTNSKALGKKLSPTDHDQIARTNERGITSLESVFNEEADSFKSEESYELNPAHENWYRLLMRYPFIIDNIDAETLERNRWIYLAATNSSLNALNLSNKIVKRYQTLVNKS